MTRTLAAGRHPAPRSAAGTPVAPRSPGGAQRALLADGRWHWQHGPIDLVIAAEGDAGAVAAAHSAAWERFDGLLAELVSELPQLRAPVRAGTPNPLRQATARRMWAACEPFADRCFITPMAAVAGSVAQELIAFYRRAGIRRAWVNNGGDIALHLAAGERTVVGLFADLARLDHATLARTVDGHALPLAGRFAVHADDPVRGIATSGWRGRSFSLGIADSVTVLAATAAMADAAATVIANAVNVDHPGIVRQPACDLKDDSDLVDTPVTVHVPPLPPESVRYALMQGRRTALALQRQGLVHAAALSAQGSVAVVAPAGAAACLDELVRSLLTVDGAPANPQPLHSAAVFCINRCSEPLRNEQRGP